MPVIYQPRGKAREYSELACNLFTGCTHACKYCYCPSIMRKSLEEWSGNPHPRSRIIQQLENEAKKMTGCEKELLFSFMSDPYQNEESAYITRCALEIMQNYNFKKVNVLTKAGFRALKDFDLLKKNGWKFGSTIIFRNESLRAEWEPGAPSIQSRYEAIKEASAQGIYTWVSVEPVVNTDEALKVMADLKQYVDFWKIGKLNHHKEIESKINWGRFLSDTKKELMGMEYYIKKDLALYDTGNE